MAEVSARRFPTTSWSCIARIKSPNEPDSRIAVAELCQRYWYPLYAYARRHGANAAVAEDWVQGFFVHLLESNVVSYARQERGRFRNFLMVSFRQFITRIHEYASAAKRKPDTSTVPLTTVDGEQRYADELINTVTPDQAFEYDWAVSLLKCVSDRLRAEQAQQGTLARFEALNGFLTDQSNNTAEAIGEQLGLSAGGVRMAVHRLKQRYGELLREEVSATLGEGENVTDEIRSLMVALQFRGCT